MILAKIKDMFQYFSTSKNYDLVYLENMDVNSPVDKVQAKKKHFELHGHRGARGLAPENTLPSFEQAIEIGVDALEMDVVITKDEKVLVSHEAWMSPEICTAPKGNQISLSELDKHRIYKMTFKETQAYDCGLKSPHKFPHQLNEECTKPLLSSVLQMATALAKNHGRKLKFNIEIKSFPQGDDIFHPKPAKFCRLVIETIRKYTTEENVYIQSFDSRILQHYHAYYPNVKLGYLIEDDTTGNTLETLGFSPYFIGLKYTQINKETLKKAKQIDAKIFAWTVNDVHTMQALIQLGVDAIITDFPNMALHLKT